MKLFFISEAPEGNQEETSESFAFALVNGALGVFEVHGRRIRDFRYSSFSIPWSLLENKKSWPRKILRFHIFHNIYNRRQVSKSITLFFC